LTNGTFVKDYYYSNPANQPKSTSIFFGKETISAGMYRLRMIVNLTDLGQFVQDDMYVQFKLPPIVTAIAGGSTRYVNKNEDLILDSGSVTQDKVKKYTSFPFDYEWECRKGVSAADVDIVQGLFGLSSAPALSTLGLPCGGVPTSGSRWSIPSASLLSNAWYLFQVYANKTTNSSIAGLELVETTRSTTAIQAVFVQLGNAPKMDIL
jgi:hypothetical protein